MSCKIIPIIFILGLFFTGCKSSNKTNRYTKYQLSKTKFLNKRLRYAIDGHKYKFEFRLRQLKDTAKSDKSVRQIAAIEALKRYSSLIDNDIYKITLKVKKNGTTENIQNLMIYPTKEITSYASRLIKAFNHYYKQYQQKNLKYLTNTTSWGRRYIQLLPETQRVNPPSFGEFYFKGASKEEVLLVLNTLQLAILQEALEIQQKVINEK